MRSILISFAFTIVASTAAAESAFTEIIIDAGFHVDQPIVTASLADDGSRHIVLAGRDDSHQQRLAVYRLNGNNSLESQPVLALTPDANLIAYDVGRLGDRDALFFISPGQILRYDIDSNKFVAVIDITSLYGQLRSGEIVPMDFIRDLNGDERDDLIVADTAGYRIRLQQSDGSLGDEILLQESSNMSVSEGVVSFRNRPLFSIDMNFDGLTDLVLWRGDSLRVYEQLPGPAFRGHPQIIPLALDLLSEAEIQAQGFGPRVVDQDKGAEIRIWSMEDFNNDKLPDILTEATLNEGVFDIRKAFRLHLGRRDGDRVVFRETEDALLASEGLQYGIISTDIDGDGKKDLLVRKVRLTFARIIRVLLSGNVSLQLHFFRMTDNDDYLEKPDYTTKTKVRFSVSSGQVDIPAIQVADFDGDGFQDLMLQTGGTRLSFHYGRPSADLFAKDSIDMTVVLPRNGDLVAVEDIDGNGRADLLIRYSEAQGDVPAKSVRLLLAH